MSRPPRIAFEDAIYHVTTRGNRRAPIFVDDADRAALLQTIGHALSRYDATAYAYCLMGNHYHIVVQTRRTNISRLMQYINGVHAQSHNRRHKLDGHLFQGRFHAVIVQKETYLLALCRYVDLNPVRAGLALDPADWRWSSFRSLAGLTHLPEWMSPRPLYECLVPHAPFAHGPEAYARFVRGSDHPSPWSTELRHGMLLGDEEFADAVLERRADSATSSGRHRQRESICLPLAQYLADPERDRGITRAHLEGGYTQTTIARAADLSVSRISRLIRAQQAKGTV